MAKLRISNLKEEEREERELIPDNTSTGTTLFRLLRQASSALQDIVWVYPFQQLVSQRRQQGEILRIIPRQHGRIRQQQECSPDCNSGGL
jgi:hypothetical protein